MQFNGKTTSKSKILLPKELAKIRHAKRTQKQIEDIKARWRDRQEKRSPLNEFCEDLKNRGIGYNDVKLLNKPLTEEEIIQKIGGRDRTVGSCVSQALAYVGNKCGYDVTDYRGRKSRKWFAKNGRNVAGKLGAMQEISHDSLQCGLMLMEKMEKGKEYILHCGRHASVVRKTKEGEIQYLELQDKKEENKWKELNAITLEERFERVITNYYEYVNSFLVDIELYKNDLGFRRLLGYLNTQK